MDSKKFFDPQTLASLEGLELRARVIVEGYLSGVHRSPYQGSSIEFAEHRQYSPGDDLRYLDWKVFGRSDKFYLKQFEEETNLICYLALDASESMLFRSDAAALSKLEYAQCTVAALAHLVVQQQDSEGLVTFDDRIRSQLRPSSNAGHLKQLVHVLEQTTAENKTSTGRVLHELAERLDRRGMVVVLSDFFDDVEQVLSGLKHLRHHRHEVVVLHVLDPAELDFPYREPTLFRGLEQLPSILAEPRAVRKAYLAEFERYRSALRRGCRTSQIDYFTLRTDRPLDEALSAYLSARGARGKHLVR